MERFASRKRINFGRSQMNDSELDNDLSPEEQRTHGDSLYITPLHIVWNAKYIYNNFALQKYVHSTSAFFNFCERRPQSVLRLITVNRKCPLEVDFSVSLLRPLN